MYDITETEWGDSLPGTVAVVKDELEQVYESILVKRAVVADFNTSYGLLLARIDANVAKSNVWACIEDRSARAVDRILISFHERGVSAILLKKRKLTSLDACNPVIECLRAVDNYVAETEDRQFCENFIRAVLATVSIGEGNGADIAKLNATIDKYTRAKTSYLSLDYLDELIHEGLTKIIHG